MQRQRTIRAHVAVEIEPVKASRFIGIARPVTSREAALRALDEIRLEVPDATHHCWAWRLADYDTRCSDDGEPRASAGQPILKQIESKDLIQTLVVVRRRYGGVKLGVGGLIRAYGAAARAALEASEIVELIDSCDMIIEHDYALTRSIELALGNWEHQVLSCKFGERVNRIIRVAANDADALRAALTEGAPANLVVRVKTAD